jgi:hypothetical protein
VYLLKQTAELIWINLSGDRMLVLDGPVLLTRMSAFGAKRTLGRPGANGRF